MKLGEFEIYKLSRETSKYVWEIYDQFDWKVRKTIGDQWLTSTDSISANIAEGFGRFHFLDKNKFYYNARGSLFEALDWTDKLTERKIISEKQSKYIISKLIYLRIKLNTHIRSNKEMNSKI